MVQEYFWLTMRVWQRDSNLIRRLLCTFLNKMEGLYYELFRERGQFMTKASRGLTIERGILTD